MISSISTSLRSAGISSHQGPEKAARQYNKDKTADTLDSLDRETTYCTCLWNFILWPFKLIGSIVTSVVGFIFNICCCCVKCRETETGIDYKKVDGIITKILEHLESGNVEEYTPQRKLLAKEDDAFTEFKEDFLRHTIALSDPLFKAPKDDIERLKWFQEDGNEVKLEIDKKLEDPVANKAVLTAAFTSYQKEKVKTKQ